MLHIIISVADQTLINHPCSFIANGTVCGLHNRLGCLLHHIQRLHRSISVQNILDKLVELAKTNPAGYTFSAGLGMAELQERTGHVHGT